jgi:hypothetical protein
MTSDPARLHLGSAADLLSYIPHALGFLPVESLVVLTLAGGRVGATLRVDLPGAGAGARGYAEGVAAILASDRAADGAVMILYTDARWSDPGRPPYRRAVRELERTLRAAGIPLRDGWVVSGTAWREYFCADAGCCPWPGRPLAEISDSTASAELVLRGSSFSASAETAAALPPGSAAAGEPSVEALTASYRRRCARSWTTASQFRATLLVWDHLLSGRRPPWAGRSTKRRPSCWRAFPARPSATRCWCSRDAAWRRPNREHTPAERRAVRASQGWCRWCPVPPPDGRGRWRHSGLLSAVVIWTAVQTVPRTTIRAAVRALVEAAVRPVIRQ